jgi:protein-tyrosine phosphatase
VHLKFTDSTDTYDIKQSPTAAWISSVLQKIIVSKPPVYIHCTSGKDRTGVVVACLLHVLGIPDDVILKEYKESKIGKLAPDHVAIALTELAKHDEWHQGVDLDKLRKCLT